MGLIMGPVTRLLLLREFELPLVSRIVKTDLGMIAQ